MVLPQRGQEQALPAQVVPQLAQVDKLYAPETDAEQLVQFVLTLLAAPLVAQIGLPPE